MTKKQKILVGVLVALAAIFLFSKFSDGESFQDELTNNFGKQAQKAEDSIEVPQLSQEEIVYNTARQRYFELSEEYPPQSWSLEQINEQIKTWETIKSCLVNYQSYMAKMDLASIGEANAKACRDISTAQQLEAKAKSAYDEYLKKKKVFDELVTLCKKYSIAVSDLGVKSITEDNYSTLNKALTRAKNLEELKTRYNTLSYISGACGVEVSKFIGSGKWFDISLTQYDNALIVASHAYESWLLDKAKSLVKESLIDLMPIVGGLGDQKNVEDPREIFWAHWAREGSHVNFATCPQLSKYSLNTEFWDNLAKLCTKYVGLAECYNEIWRGCKHFDYPAYMCQSKENWPNPRSLQALIENDRNANGGDHLATRRNHQILFQNYDKKVAPFRMSDNYVGAPLKVIYKNGVMYVNGKRAN